jgi:diguanylate cyclase (GGDEF)-like protein
MSHTPANPFDRLSHAERRRLLIPATIIAILVELIVISQSLNPMLSQYTRAASALLGSIGLVYTWLLFQFLYPKIQQYLWPHTVIILVNAIGLGLLGLLLRDNIEFLIDILAITAVTVSAILSGRWLTYFFLLIISGINFIGFVWLSPLQMHEAIHVLGFTLVGLVINETIQLLGNAISAKVQRLETINQMSRKIGATIEVDEVISLVSAAVQDAIHADTYYVGLVRDDSLHLELFFDDGEFFPGQEIPLKGGLAGWVIENRKSLLLSDVPKDIQRLKLPLRVIGKPKTSLSWIGTPMLAGSHLVGIMAMASYQRNSFDEADLELLENLAHQAALVIDNAYHHAEVKRQSQLDSLTQVYNHGNFLERLHEITQHARHTNVPLTLIMLDVDHFKQYNDTYGHLVGDQALNQVVAAIRENIRSSDILGRWGGEEFAVLLPDTDARQAMQAARRISQTLRTLTVITPQGEQISPPTISQGIVMLSEVSNALKLVDLADQRLYIAKDRGRDQIEPPESFWEQSSE